MDFTTETINSIQEDNPSYKALDNGFAKAASALGIASIVTAIFGLATIPLMLGGLAIILAILSRGRGSMEGRAVRGMTCGIVGMTISIALIAYVIYLFCISPTYRSLINSQCETMYGYTLNDVIEDYVGDGFDLEEYLTR